MRAQPLQYDPAYVSKRQKYRLQAIALGGVAEYPAPDPRDSVRIGVAIHKFVQRYGGGYTQRKHRRPGGAVIVVTRHA